MRPMRHLIATVALLGALLPWPALAEDVPVLAVLEYSSGLFGKRDKIPARTGSGRTSFAGKSKSAWTLLEGTTLAQARPPAERIIQFYQATDKDPILICRITVRYVRSPRGWRPAYILVPPEQVRWDGTKMLPVDTGIPGTIRVVRVAGQTSDGYVHNLTFASHTGPLQIDLWEVQ